MLISQTYFWAGGFFFLFFFQIQRGMTQDCLTCHNWRYTFY